MTSSSSSAPAHSTSERAQASTPLTAPTPRWRAAWVARAPRSLVAWMKLAWWYVAVPAIIFYSTLAPRLQLARSLDLVTDEGVYIPTGTLDVTLLQLHDLTSRWWLLNYEAPALPKLIIGLGSLYGAQHDHFAAGWLYGARVPAVWLSAITFTLFFYLMAPIVGKRASALASMVLALSPWVAYFGSLAYLDTYLLCFMTLATPLFWYAARRPWLYPLAGLFLGLAFASKYTAAALVIPIALYLLYYYRGAARRRIPKRLLLAPLVAALTVYISDPVIWLNPLTRLWDSMLFQFDHASNGHNVFWNGQVWEQHVPIGIGLFILLAKLSLLLTIPAVVTLVWMGGRLLMRWRAHEQPTERDDRWVFVLTWLVGLLIPFGVLPIVVGTHYMLPLAPPTAIVAAFGLVVAGDTLAARCAVLFTRWMSQQKTEPGGGARIGEFAGGRVSRWLDAANMTPTQGARWALTAVLTVVIAVALIAPPAHGLATTYQAEGYTAEWLNGENGTLQVAYTGYSDAVDWITAHSQGRTTVTLISSRGALDFWRDTHRYGFFPDRIRLAYGTPTDFPQSQYIVWPEHLIQRKFPTPTDMNTMIIHRVQGGATTYCVILKWPHPNR